MTSFNNYLDVIRFIKGIELTASDPMDYSTINWSYEETHELVRSGNIVSETKIIDVEPIPCEELDAVVRDDIIERLKVCVNDKILGGFKSDALGEEHFYGSGYEDQINIIGAVVANTDLHYTCTDENGVKERRLHTKEQIKKVFFDGVMYKEFIIAQYHKMVSDLQSMTGEELFTFKCYLCEQEDDASENQE